MDISHENPGALSAVNVAGKSVDVKTVGNTSVELAGSSFSTTKTYLQ